MERVQGRRDQSRDQSKIGKQQDQSRMDMMEQSRTGRPLAGTEESGRVVPCTLL